MPKHGQFKGTPARRAAFIESIRDLGEGDECIFWPWSDVRGRYIRAYINGRKMPTHRWVYEQIHGPLEVRHTRGAFGDDLVLHTCDVKACCRPSHLYLGDAQNNANDAATRGRLRKKLSNDDVIRIRQLNAVGVPSRQLAEAFGVSYVHIWMIVNRKTRTIGMP